MRAQPPAAACAPGRSGPPTARRRAAETGAALVLVLLVAACLTLAGMAGAFLLTLDTLAARNAQQAALAEGRAQGAVAAGAWAAAAPSSGGAPSLAALWARLGWDPVVDVEPVTSGGVRIAATAAVGRASAQAALTLRLDGGGLRVQARE